MREFLCKEPLSVSQALNFHFFLSDNFISVLKNEPALLVGMFPREIAALTNKKEAATHIYLYYKKDNADITEEELIKNIGFYNRDQFKMNIEYHFVTL